MAGRGGAAGGDRKVSWQDIQQNTFTRWCNLHLAKRGLHITDLSKDLCNGVMLCNLMEIISGKSIGGFNKHPRVPMQKAENCKIAVDFIQDEGIKLVNLSGDDVFNGRLKLILGLIWTLILRYQIKNGDGDDELLRWVQSKIPEKKITGFTKDWNDGTAICALVEALRPGYCPTSSLPGNPLGNATQGITTADDRMGVAPLILPDEMIHPKVDDHAMRTYISQFRNLADDYKQSDAKKCAAYGPGLVSGVVNTPGKFRVDTPASTRGVLAIKVVGPANEAKATLVPIAGAPGSYTVDYTPNVPGTWHVHVTLDKEHIPGSIFVVTVLDEVSLGGEGKIQVFFSSTSSTEKGRQDFFDLERLMTSKSIHLRPDFQPWCPVDILDKEDRDAIFAKAGTRTLPIVFIDDKYQGDYDAMVRLNEAGRLDEVLQTMRHAPLLAQSREKKDWAVTSGTEKKAAAAGGAPGLGRAPSTTPEAKAGGAAPGLVRAASSTPAKTATTGATTGAGAGAAPKAASASASGAASPKAAAATPTPAKVAASSATPAATSSATPAAPSRAAPPKPGGATAGAGATPAKAGPAPAKRW